MANISLRPLSPEDIDAEYTSWYQNNDGHLDFFTGSNRSFTQKILEDDFEKGAATKKWFYFIILADNGDRIGNVKIGPIDLKNKTSDLVCLIGNRNYLGKGLAQKAIQLASNLAFDKFDIRRLHGGMYQSNIPSIKAYTRAGWFIEATLKGYYLVDGKAEDRICVAYLNPRYFGEII